MISDSGRNNDELTIDALSKQASITAKLSTPEKIVDEADDSDTNRLLLESYEQTLAGIRPLWLTSVLGTRN
jgi:hypothetical protein